MLIVVEISDSLAGQLHLGEKVELRVLLRSLVAERIAEGGYAVVEIGEGRSPDDRMSEPVTQRPPRDPLARLRRIYGDVALNGDNAVLKARAEERY